MTASAPVLSRVTSEGKITLPRDIREGLQVREGESLVLQELADGIVMLFKAPTTRQQLAERLLKNLVVGVGQEAENIGIREENDLDAIAKAIRKRSFVQRYGEQTV